MRIYIAEDDPSVISILEEIIESCGLGEVCGSSGERRLIRCISRSLIPTSFWPIF